MTLLIGLLFSPALLLLIVPLATFAAITSILAFSTLFFRVLLVYAELAGVLLQNQFSAKDTPRSGNKSISASLSIQRTKNAHRRRSSSNGGSTTPKAPELSGLGAYGSGNPIRDYEGVGGWRVPSSEDEDVLWTHMNSRLELPALADNRARNHHRSSTSSTLIAIPMLTPSPTQSRARTPTRSQTGHPPSPEEYFANRRPSKSTSSLDTANIGRAMRRRKASSSSGSSYASTKSASLDALGG